MLYKNQIFQKVNIGDRFEGYIRRITDDNRIDLTLRKEGYDGVAVSADALLKLIEENGGELSIGDNSSPEKVHALTQMSKKVFKRAVGILLKRGVITTDGESITLKK
ncbi:MAG: hypothetical protein U0L21_05055 [Alistipes sp.]|nr:hypothetical protein [Alistipes sp.]